MQTQFLFRFYRHLRLWRARRIPPSPQHLCWTSKQSYRQFPTNFPPNPQVTQSRSFAANNSQNSTAHVVHQIPPPEQSATRRNRQYSRDRTRVSLLDSTRTSSPSGRIQRMGNGIQHRSEQRWSLKLGYTIKSSSFNLDNSSLRVD